MTLKADCYPLRWPHQLVQERPWALVVIAMAILPYTARAEDPAMNCLIRIDGVIYDAAPCDLNSDDEGIIRFGHLNLDEQAGYWVNLIEQDDGTYEGFWNENFGAALAHTPLGILTNQDRSGSDCFNNQGSLLCWNIPADTPIYDVEFRSLEEGGHAVLAYLDGIEYEVPHPNWEALQPYFIEQFADLDDDGHMETLIGVSHGGNCCPNDISILSYRGDGFFTYLDEAPISGGWGGVAIVTEAGRPIIRVYDAPAGYGNTVHQRGERDYAIINGHPELIAERTEFGIPSKVAGLDLEEVQSAEGQRESLTYDIDQDGQLDVIDCSYWQRWGVLNCTVQISGAITPVEFQCHRVSVSPSVFGPNRSHRLLCDGQVVDY